MLKKLQSDIRQVAHADSIFQDSRALLNIEDPCVPTKFVQGKYQGVILWQKTWMAKSGPGCAKFRLRKFMPRRSGCNKESFDLIDINRDFSKYRRLEQLLLPLENVTWPGTINIINGDVIHRGPAGSSRFTPFEEGNVCEHLFITFVDQRASYISDNSDS